jgi:aldose 1-epimerase
MRLNLLSLGALVLPVACAESASTSSTNASTTGPDEDGKYWIYGEGLAAAFIPYGASISNLLINDKNGIQRDIVAGFDNASYYEIDKQHPHFGGVPGRYANRIKNSSFELDGVTYNILPNENPTADHPDGVDTLHGGPNGWDWRNFTVVAHTNNSITFSIVDPDGEQGFPGEVISYITYTLGNMTWDFKMVAIPTTKKTPIMLSSHTYWNLDGFANNETNLALNHTFYTPYSGQRVDVDNILIPTGDILANHPGSVNDFWSAPKQIGSGFQDTEIQNNCGFNCSGYGKCLSTGLKFAKILTMTYLQTHAGS